MWYSGAGGKLIHEKNQKQKISWHCPFNYCLIELLLLKKKSTSICGSSKKQAEFDTHKTQIFDQWGDEKKQFGQHRNMKNLLLFLLILPASWNLFG